MDQLEGLRSLANILVPVIVLAIPAALLQRRKAKKGTASDTDDRGKIKD